MVAWMSIFHLESVIRAEYRARLPQATPAEGGPFSRAILAGRPVPGTCNRRAIGQRVPKQDLRRSRLWA
jgi:hypothetical protein